MYFSLDRRKTCLESVLHSVSVCVSHRSLLILPPTEWTTVILPVSPTQWTTLILQPTQMYYTDRSYYHPPNGLHWYYHPPNGLHYNTTSGSATHQWTILWYYYPPNGLHYNTTSGSATNPMDYTLMLPPTQWTTLNPPPTKWTTLWYHQPCNGLQYKWCIRVHWVGGSVTRVVHWVGDSVTE